MFNFRKSTVAALAVVALALGGCANTGMGNKEMVGTAGGAAIGGLLGSMVGGGAGKLVGTGLGVALGGFIGNQIGRGLDQSDKLEADRSAQVAVMQAPVGQPINWNNSQNGNYGNTVVTREGRTPDGGYCREYRQTVNVGGRAQQMYGTACRQPDGTWRQMSQ